MNPDMCETRRPLEDRVNDKIDTTLQSAEEHALDAFVKLRRRDENPSLNTALSVAESYLADAHARVIEALALLEALNA